MWIQNQSQQQMPGAPAAPQGYGCSVTGANNSLTGSTFGASQSNSGTSTHPNVVYLQPRQNPNASTSSTNSGYFYQQQQQQQPPQPPPQQQQFFFVNPQGQQQMAPPMQQQAQAQQPPAWWGAPQAQQQPQQSGQALQMPQFVVPQQQPQQQQFIYAQPQQGAPGSSQTAAPQVVILPNGQYAILQPSGMAPPPFGQQQAPLTVSLPQAPPPPPQLLHMPQVLPSPQRPGGFNSSGCHSPNHSTTNMPQMGGSATSASRTGAQAMGASTSTTSRPLSDTAVWGYAVVDPYHPTLQRVPVPPSVVAPTKGVKAYNNDVSISSTKPCASIMCMRYVGGGGCPLEEQCQNFHVRADYVEAARAMTEPLCCGLHNDYFTREMLRGHCAPHMTDSKFTLVLEDRSEVDVLPGQLAFTVGLDHLSIRGQSRVINAKKQVCRLHLEGRCKWTKDCGHVHLCRELYRFLQQFHFPSLVFLLSTETDINKLRSKLHEVKEFVRSRSCLPLTSHLIAAGRASAVACLAEVGALFTVGMAQVASAELSFDAPVTQVLPQTDFASEAVRKIAKQQPAGAAADAKPALPQEAASASSSVTTPPPPAATEAAVPQPAAA